MKLPGPLNDEQQKQLKTVQSSARHLLALINDLLDVSKIEAGKVELNLENVDPRLLLEEVAATLQPQALGKGLSLIVMGQAHGGTIQTDRRALSQIVLNLAGNALKFTDHGHVRLILEQGSPGACTIHVEDTGIGIPPEEQSKLFGAFSRVRNERPDAPEGTGLGLHLSQRLAALLGGKIIVNSEGGKGSTFSLVLTGS
jgi:protein-histidine pros-kinase